MVVKTPEAPESPITSTGRDAFVGISELDVARKPTVPNPLKDLVGERIVFAAVRSSEEKPKGEADIYKLSQVEFNEDGTFTLPDPGTWTTVDLSRGMLRTLAAAAEKSNGRNVTATVVQKQRGLGLE